MKHRSSPSFIVSILILGSLAALGADWPCWRGPDGLGISSETGFPTRWSKTENIRWTYTPGGKGASSPVVVSDRVYLTFQTEDTGMHLVAIQRDTGTVIWDSELSTGKSHAHDLHNMATPSPVSDGQRIWVRFGTGYIGCVDWAGKQLWHRDLSKEFGEYHANHGMGTSPMLNDGILYVACMHQGPSYFLALEAVTGKTLWKKDRMMEPKDEAQDSYSSPIFVRSGAGTQVVLAGAEAVNSYDPKSGDELWVHGGLRVPHAYGRTISGPTAGDGVVVVVASGFQNRGYTIALDAKGHGKRPETDRLWTCSKFSPDCGTPLVYRGKVYWMRDDGIASCVDARTGEAHWQERLFSANVKVSPVAAEGRVYFLNGQGNCAVVKASTKLEVVSTNELNEPTLSTPALSKGRVFLRTDKHLYCIGQ